MTLKVAEMFETIQGEGPSIGTPAIFIRLMGCNQACTWCDTPYTWDASRYDLSKEGKRIDQDDIVQFIQDKTPRLIVLTGGEPMLHQKQLFPIMYWLYDRRYRIEMETAGTIAPHDEFAKYVSFFNVSPKLASSGNPKELRYKPELLRGFVFQARLKKACFKFVVGSDADLEEVDDIVREVGIPNHFVYLMPEGTSHDAIMNNTPRLVAHAIRNDYRVTTRLHVSIWGAKRGV